MNDDAHRQNAPGASPEKPPERPPETREPSETPPGGEVAAARLILDRTFIAYLCFSGALLVAMTLGLLPSPEAPTAPEATRYGELLKGLLVLLFFAATVVNLGIRWAGRIAAARRYRRSKPYRAARTVAFSQWLCFGVYGLFEAAAVYHRLAVAAPRKVLVIATLAAIFASFYFLKVPKYMLKAIFTPSQHNEKDDVPGKTE
ncbi:MAG: hypothetical protein J7M19_08135 [Planctomycetes bacterium]|nr:hypothetical protein [Planctomycetota bacterium]